MFAVAMLATAIAAVRGQSDEQEHRSHGFGQIVGRAGDVDLDGVPDVLVGEPIYDLYSPIASSLCTLSGRTGDEIRHVELPEFRHMVWRAEGGVDVDADGIPDALVYGNAYVGSIRFGRLVVLSGKSGLKLHQFDVDDPPTASGDWAHLVGDVDGDGVADVGWLVLDHGEKQSELWLRSGKTGSVLDSLDVLNEFDSHVGSFAATGDLDGDGLPDFVVVLGRCEYDRCCARAYSLKKHAPLWEFRSTVRAHEMHTSVVDVGDIDGDCVHDIALGLMNRVELISGKTGQPLRHFEGHCPDDFWSHTDECEFGQALAPITDRRSDATRYLAISQPGFEGFGRVCVFALSDALPRSISAPSKFAIRLGWELAELGDIDGDGVTDAVVGANGLVRIVSGSNGSSILELRRVNERIQVTRGERP